MPVSSRRFRYGIEHESALLRPDGAFADFTNTHFDELQDIVDAMPEDPADLADLRVGDVGIKRKRWYVEGYERFDEQGTLVRCDPKGLEIRTRIHPSVEAAVAALCADQQRLDVEAAARGLGVTAISFNPVHSEYVVEPAFNAWERVHRLGSPEERTAHLHMTTYGPDLNLSWEGSPGDPPEPDELIDAARKLTALSPYLVPLSFSSPFRDGGPWGGLSARTALRTGPRPAVLAFLAEGVPQVPSDPSLTQPARLPAEVGRLEFKAFDSCPDPRSTASCSALLTGLVLDTTLPQRAHDPGSRRCTGTRRASATGTRRCGRARRPPSTRRLRPSPTARPTLPASRPCAPASTATSARPATMLARYEAGDPVAGLRPRPCARSARRARRARSPRFPEPTRAAAARESVQNGARM